MKITKRFMKFLEEVKDPEFNPDEVEDLDDVAESPADFDVEATPEADVIPSDSGSAVTVVTPKGTSVSVTERLKRSVRHSRRGRMLEDATIVFTNKDIEDFNSGKSIDDILKKRISQPWNESLNEDVSVGDSEFFGGEVETDDFEELDISNQETFDTPTACDDPTCLDDKEVCPNCGDKECDGSCESSSSNEFDSDPENPLSELTSSSEEKVVTDPIGEALSAMKKLKKDASISGNVEDAEKSPLKVQKTNGVKNKKEVK